MNWKLQALGALCITIGLAGSSAIAADSDGDGVDNWIEESVLNALAPEWYPQFSRRLQPIDWMVRHGYAKVYRRSDGAQVGRVPASNVALTPDQFLAQMAAASVLWPHAAYEYRWAYFNRDQGRDTNDPNDPFDWNIAVAQGRGVYGRVTPSPDTPGLLQVQYFVHFGWNETDTPPGCNAGNHEGDWISVDFDVDATDVNRPRIVRAWYHNHGRQVFVESADAIAFSGTHPRVYLEHGTQETWPFAASGGFQPGQVPPCVTTNRRIDFGQCTLEYESACNGGYTSVREHEGLFGGYLIAPKNIGEIAHPANNEESHFIHQYPGRYGSAWEGGCWWLPFDLVDSESPFGPTFGSNRTKMWDRSFDVTLQWPSCNNQSTVWASPVGGSSPDGSQANPMRTLGGSLGVVAPTGVINLGPGTYADGPLTIRQPVTITATNGIATIAP